MPEDLILSATPKFSYLTKLCASADSSWKSLIFSSNSSNYVSIPKIEYEEQTADKYGTESPRVVKGRQGMWRGRKGDDDKHGVRCRVHDKIILKSLNGSLGTSGEQAARYIKALSFEQFSTL